MGGIQSTLKIVLPILKFLYGTTLSLDLLKGPWTFKSPKVQRKSREANKKNRKEKVRPSKLVVDLHKP